MVYSYKNGTDISSYLDAHTQAERERYSDQKVGQRDENHRTTVRLGADAVIVIRVRLHLHVANA